MLTAIYTVLVFCLVIAVHEFGHFATAKLTGMTVHEFSIGMGPKIWSYSSKNTDYSIRIFPIGGFVKLEGEDEKSDDVNAFCNKSPWKRILVLSSGAFMNFILGFVLFIILFSCSAGITTNVVGKLIEGSAFENSFVLEGDKIIRMEGAKYSTNVYDYNDINYFLIKNGDSQAKITFERDDQIMVKTVKPAAIDGYEGKKFGFQPLVVKPNFSNVITSSVRQSLFVIKIVVNSLVDLFTGKVNISNMSGPVGIVREIDSAAKEGMAYNLLRSLLNVMSLSAIITINLGVFNLFPLPALDGGRILIVLIEVIRRKPIDKDKEGIFHFIGFALLIALMITITFFDIGKLIS